MWCAGICLYSLKSYSQYGQVWWISHRYGIFTIWSWIGLYLHTQPITYSLVDASYSLIVQLEVSYQYSILNYFATYPITYVLLITVHYILIKCFVGEALQYGGIYVCWVFAKPIGCNKSCRHSASLVNESSRICTEYASMSWKKSHYWSQQNICTNFKRCRTKVFRAASISVTWSSVIILTVSAKTCYGYCTSSITKLLCAF